MSAALFLEKLLDGADVDWVPLKELGELVRGNGLPKSDFTENGIPAIHYGQIYTYYGLSTSSTISFVSTETAAKLKKVNTGDVVITNTSETFEDVGTPLVYHGKEQAVTGGHATIFKPSSKILGMYFAYFTQTYTFQKLKRPYSKGAKVIDISAKDLSKILIPIPFPRDPERSLAIQGEIVRRLDTFTELTTELTTELNARKKQYNYYRDKLLTYKEGMFEWRELGGLAENLDSMRRPITRNLREPGDIPYYGASGIVDYVKDYIFDGDFLLVSEDGANLLARSTPIAFSISGKNWVNNHAHILKFGTYAERRYVEYYLNSIDLTPFISGAAQPKLNQKNLNRISIPIPFPNDPERSFAEQARIVAMLDTFDTLTSSLTEGLPFEIELREKQYGYYRDQLFSFPGSERIAA